MPTTQKSTSTRSAHNESDAIGIQDAYYLSDYAFQIQRNSVASSTYDQITAVCTYKDGKNARQAIQIPSSEKVDGWYVEANETEATVYAIVGIPKESDKRKSEDFPEGISYGSAPIIRIRQTGQQDVWAEGATSAFCYLNGTRLYSLAASASDGTWKNYQIWNDQQEHNVRQVTPSSYTHDGKTVYYSGGSSPGSSPWGTDVNVPINNFKTVDQGKAAWTIIYGTPVSDEYDFKDMLVGRFAIELEDAGGDGPGSDWDDPGDWNEDWEEGDPTQTLHVEVIGALSGRHNDPIEDPSYSYIPADKDTVKGYGCGGDGGHGGGGGAGASTVVVHKFATNQADNKEVIALARRHGYGSGGGKGGKGGDGCILVYY